MCLVHSVEIMFIGDEMCHCTTISFFLKKEKDFLFKKRLWKIVRRNIGGETAGISLGVFTTIDTITINTKEEESLSLFIKHHSHHMKSKWPQKTNRSSPFWQSIPCGEDGSSPLPFRGRHSSVLPKDLFGEKIFWQSIFLSPFSSLFHVIASLQHTFSLHHMHIIRATHSYDFRRQEMLFFNMREIIQ